MSGRLLLLVTLLSWFHGLGKAQEAQEAQEAKPAERAKLAESTKPTERAANPSTNALPVAALTRTTPVDFEKEVLPLFRSSCLACHNRTKAKADLVLETPADLLKGGESGPAIVPGKGDQSLLLKISAHQEKPYMPPKDNKVEAANLTAEQLGLLKLWIDQGGTGEVRRTAVVDWQPIPAGVNPIYAVALSPDGCLAACGRGNQLALYNLATEQLVGRLTDSNLITSGLYSTPGFAHRDLVNSLAFNHDGSVLASGDYQMVKLWRRERIEKQLPFQSPGAELPTVTALTSSSDGQWLATGHAGGNVLLWQTQSGLLKTQWVAHREAIRILKFSPAGDRLATIAESGPLRIWETAPGTSAVAISTPSAVQSLAWLADGKRLVTTHGDALARLWVLPTGSETNATLGKEIKSPSGNFRTVAAHPTVAPRFVTGGDDGIALLWDGDNGAVLNKFEQGDAIAALAFRPDGQRLAVGGSNSAVQIWNVEDATKRIKFQGDYTAAQAADRLESDLNFVKSEVTYRKNVVEEAKKREQTESDFAAKALDNRVTAEKNLTENQKAVLAAVEARVAIEKMPAELQAEHKKSTETLATAEATAKQAQMEATNARARVDQAKSAAETATKATAELVKAIEADGGKTIALLDAKAAAEKLAALAKLLATDSQKIAENLTQAAEPKTLLANEARTLAGKTTATIAEKLKQVPEKLAAALKNQESKEKEVETALVAKRSSEDQLLASQRAAQKAAEAVPEAIRELQLTETAEKQRDTEGQSAKKALVETFEPVHSLTYSPDGAVLASVGTRGHTRIWGAETGLGMGPMLARTVNPVAVGFSADSSVIALGGNSVPVRTQSRESWSLEKTLVGTGTTTLSGRVNALQFSHDGKWLVTGSGESSRSGELLVWKVATGQLERNYTNAHSDVVLSVDFSGDDKLLASAGADRFVKIWSLESGKMIRSFEGHTHHVLGVRWKRDRRTLASAGADKVIKLWNFVTGEQKRTITGAEKEVTSLEYVDTTNEMLVTSGDAQARLMSEDGKTVRTFGDAKDFMQVALISPDARWVIGGGQDNRLRLWDGRSGRLVKTFDP